MEKLIVLGTGNAGATRCYNTCFILLDGKEPLLVDAGGGNAIFTQLERAGIRPSDIHHAFLTHCHTEHLFGMIWMIRSVAQNIRGGSYEGTFTLYCHDELAGVVHSVADMTLPASMTQYIGDRILIVPVGDGEESPFGSYRATFFDIGSTKAKQFGFMLGLHSGKKLSCLGDEPCTPRGRKYAAGSGWLLSEAFCLYADRDRFKPYEKHHSTVREACETGGARIIVFNVAGIIRLESPIIVRAPYVTNGTRRGESRALAYRRHPPPRAQNAVHGRRPPVFFRQPLRPGRSGIHRPLTRFNFAMVLLQQQSIPKNLRTGIR